MSSYIATSNDSYKEIGQSIKVQKVENTEEPKIKLNAHFGLTAPNDKTAFKYWIQCNEPENVLLSSTTISNNSNLDYNKMCLQYNTTSNNYNLINQNGFNLNASLYQGWLGNIENKANKVDIWYPDLSEIADKQFNYSDICYYQATNSTSTYVNTLTLTHSCNIGDRLLVCASPRGNTADFTYTYSDGWTEIHNILLDKEAAKYSCYQRFVVLTKIAENTTESITITQPKVDRLFMSCISFSNTTQFEILNESFGYSNSVSVIKPVEDIVIWAIVSMWSAGDDSGSIQTQSLLHYPTDKTKVSSRLRLYIDSTSINTSHTFNGGVTAGINKEYLVYAIPIKIDGYLGKFGAWVNTYNKTIYEGE